MRFFVVVDLRLAPQKRCKKTATTNKQQNAKIGQSEKLAKNEQQLN